MRPFSVLVEQHLNKLSKLVERSLAVFLTLTIVFFFCIGWGGGGAGEGLRCVLVSSAPVVYRKEEEPGVWASFHHSSDPGGPTSVSNCQMGVLGQRVHRFCMKDNRSLSLTTSDFTSNRFSPVTRLGWGHCGCKTMSRWFLWSSFCPSPRNLPAKSVEETQRHKLEYEEMVAGAKRRGKHTRLSL